MSDLKVCPFCAEEIKAAATKCKHCGEFLTEEVADIGLSAGDSLPLGSQSVQDGAAMPAVQPGTEIYRDHRAIVTDKLVTIGDNVFRISDITSVKVEPSVSGVLQGACGGCLGAPMVGCGVMVAITGPVWAYSGMVYDGPSDHAVGAIVCGSIATGIGIVAATVGYLMGKVRSFALKITTAGEEQSVLTDPSAESLNRIAIAIQGASTAVAP